MEAYIPNIYYSKRNKGYNYIRIWEYPKTAIFTALNLNEKEGCFFCSISVLNK